MLYIGCAVWAYDGWANNFFPQGLPKDERLQSYARRLTAVEINATFYATPALPTVKKWADETPESFRFSPKFPKAITHAARLKDSQAQTATFIGAMRMLGPRLGPLMIQLPPSFGPVQLPLLRNYLAELPQDLQIAVEIRHPDWFRSEYGVALDKLLAEFKAIRVVFDSRPIYASKSPEAVLGQEKKPNVPLIALATQPFVVVRYISSPVAAENERYFDEWAPRIAGWLGEGRDVYFFAHCPVEEYSPDFARSMYRRVSTQPGVNLPELPWEKADNPTSAANLSQLSLF